MRGKVRAFEIALLILGSLLLAVFVLGYARRQIMSRAAVVRMAELKAPSVESKQTSLVQRTFPVDFSLWSSKRISEYEQSLLSHLDPPTAVLRISKIGLEVPVFEGTDDLTLNRAVGHIAGTPQPGETAGNIGIAGHRDSFFRKLKDIASGDTIELEMPDRVDTYRVTQIVIVTPDDVSVLQPRPAPGLTLVTCYPFYFIGSAPKRYIVEAALVSSKTPVAQERHVSSLRFASALDNSNQQSQTPAKEITQ